MSAKAFFPKPVEPLQALHQVLAPAKLNLFLHITAQRADGYHELQSLFTLIDWFDVLDFELSLTPEIKRLDRNCVLPAEDLIVKAARLLQQASQTSFGATIAIEKNIPAHAGMGGGSSDAASTLLALNQLWGLKWPVKQLLPLGLQLGADVPFFLLGRNAFAQGIGELLTPMVLPKAQFLVVKPLAGLDTGLIFSDPHLQRDTKTATIADFAEAVHNFGRNDLQPVAQKLCPEMNRAMDWIKSLGLTPKMTGSGSAVFAKLSQPLELPQAPEDWQIKVCSSLEIHPLNAWISLDD
jgi:4-diphosphocytidyl-2-C-methyl-D-erythritol kinase